MYILKYYYQGNPIIDINQGRITRSHKNLVFYLNIQLKYEQIPFVKRAISSLITSVYTELVKRTITDDNNEEDVFIESDESGDEDDTLIPNQYLTPVASYRIERNDIMKDDEIEKHDIISDMKEVIKQVKNINPNIYNMIYQEIMSRKSDLIISTLLN